MAAEQRRLLEQLMGDNFMGASAASKTANLTLSSPQVCRSYLVGTCPHDLFTNTKQDIGPCSKLHPENLKIEWDGLSEAEKTKYGFEYDYVRDMQKYIDECNRRIDQAQRRLEKTPDEIRQTNALLKTISDLTKTINTGLLEISCLGEIGSVSLACSEFYKVRTAKLAKEQAERDLKALSDTSGPSGHQKLQVCDVCGAYLSRLDNDRRLADHFYGKMHLGYAQMRKTYESLQKELKGKPPPFYGTVLGLKPRTVPELQAGRLAWFDIADSGQQVHIACGDNLESNSSRHPCFKIESGEALLELQKRIWAYYKQGSKSAPKDADKPGEQNSVHQPKEPPPETDSTYFTVDDLQSFTANIVPHPPWILTENVTIPTDLLTVAADTIIANVGEDGIEQIGGRKWWQWRRNTSPLKAEWIEMRADYHERKRTNAKSDRVMLYVHGGGYFFGSVDEHRYQMQRHARKLKARVIAPRYRLAPQFPFPCGLHDCLAVYLYLLTAHDATEIILAGDSAGGGMVLSIMCLLRDQNLPLPAGAVLISPWVDLTHSFPSLAAESPMDYLPPHGFHHKPSTSWPPLNEDEVEALNRAKSREDAVLGKASTLTEPLSDQTAPVQGINEVSQANPVPRQHHHLSVEVDGIIIQIRDQTQMYTTNQLLSHPLVSPVLQPSLGGLPPILILAGGGELLRDEQIYLAHKAADPQKYPLGPQYRARYDPGDKILNKYKPTPVQLQVWEDLCHAAPTLSFTRPAKYMYRSIAQFGAWALARAQDRPIEIVDDDNISIISSETSASSRDESRDRITRQRKPTTPDPKVVGKAGDPIPIFKSHMIRQLVDRYGNIFPLPRADELPATSMDPSEVGIVKSGPLKKWLAAKRQYEVRTAEDEMPPKLKKSYGLSMWSGWGSKHDELTIKREGKVVGHGDSGAKVNEEKASQVDHGQHGGLEPLNTRESMRRLSKSLGHKTALHLQGDSKTMDSDVASAVTGYSMPSVSDHASTMAIFCAPGISKETTATTDQQQLAQGKHASTNVMSGNGFPASTTPTLSFPDTNAGTHAVHSSDTPASRRSLERLRTNNYLITPGYASESASVQTETTSVDGLKTKRLVGPVRNPSMTAVVLVEGVAAVVDGDGDGRGWQEDDNDDEGDVRSQNKAATATAAKA
ncbi:hypothetical protein DV736_g355, partial [Chaetothyriales sp. CBS 134916]